MLVLLILNDDLLSGKNTWSTRLHIMTSFYALCSTNALRHYTALTVFQTNTEFSVVSVFRHGVDEIFTILEFYVA